MRYLILLIGGFILFIAICCVLIDAALKDYCLSKWNESGYQVKYEDSQCKILKDGKWFPSSVILVGDL